MAKINRYSMILCVDIIIDNHNRSQLGATALVSDETKKIFSWLFDSLNRPIDKFALSLLYTDANPAMIAEQKNLYKIHSKLIEEFEDEIARKTKKNLGHDNDLTEFTKFAYTVSNPIDIRLKGENLKEKKLLIFFV
ncbi:hypothetical protein C2G38_2167246 [Gigaspora rosea]|uniref:Uncharacterized protein n=1 Tax=Gigaspora rosea TaxID=44941 RepID=A0A397VVC6_9GLOM|nr:hypothetical protein C2G38_2167246 [Gigaspora rosea]